MFHFGTPSLAPLNLSGRLFEFRLNGDDWTDFVTKEGIEIDMPDHEVLGGLNLTTAKLKLQIPINGVGLPHSANPRIDRTYWGRGASVIIRVANESGALTAASSVGSNFYLLRSPQQPYQASPSAPLLMDLEIGCRLSLENFSEPVDVEATGINPGIITGRELAVQNLLARRGIPVTLPSMAYPLDFPVASVTRTETPIQFAGAIAATAGYALRWNGTEVTADSVSVDDGSVIANLNYSANGNVELFQPSGDLSEPLIEKLILEGIYSKALPATDETPLIIEEKIPGDGGEVRVSKRTTIIRTRSTATTEIEEIPDNYGFPPGGLQFVSRFIESNIYDALGRIVSTSNEKQTTANILELNGFDLTFAEAFSLRFGGRNTKVYIYATRGNGTVYLSKTIETNQGFAAGVIPDYFTKATALAFGPTTIERVTTEWIETAKDTWTYTRRTEKLAGLIAPDKYPTLADGAGTVLLFDNSLTKRSQGNTGEDAPPAIAYINPANQFDEIPLKYTLISTFGFPQVAIARQRSMKLDHVVSESQLEFMGKLINGLVAGRSTGWAVVAKLTNVFLGSSFKPFCQVNVTYAGYVYHLKVNAIKYVLTQSKSYVAFLGIDCGVESAGGGGGVIPPITRTFELSNTPLTLGGRADPIVSRPITADCEFTLSGSADASTISASSLFALNGSADGRVTEALRIDIFLELGGSANASVTRSLSLDMAFRLSGDSTAIVASSISATLLFVLDGSAFSGDLPFNLYEYYNSWNEQDTGLAAENKELAEMIFLEENFGGKI